MLIFERRPQETAREYALRTIKENIVRLELPPGSQVGENELATQLGLSRTPVREALMELAKVKIVDIQPQKKGVVAPIDMKLVEEARFTRSVMECSVVELVCSMATEEQLLALDENVKLQQFYLENHMPDRLQEMDDRFHASLFAIAEKALTHTMMQNMAIHFDRLREMSLYSVKELKIVQDHAQIVEAVRKGDPAEARRLMDFHLRRTHVDLEAIKAAYPQYF
ncbi:MAG: GntR family transcriptional regulator [Clostridiales bacterium]|nr:GntR family transcriptional regulator [Clostridiales bacterium]